MVKISIVIPTLGRTAELDECLKSICSQDYKNFDVVVVDQNYPGLIDYVIAKYADSINIKHLNVDFRGTSRAKNYALNSAEGEYLFFLDDDAELLPDTLNEIIRKIDKESIAVLFGRCIDREGNDSVMLFSKVESLLSLDHHEGMFIESTMVIKRSVFASNQFDESLGVGAFHGAEEGYDLVLRLLKQGMQLLYSPDFMVYHPQKISTYSDQELRRVFHYRCGYAKLCQKHSLNLNYCKRAFLVFFYVFYCVLVRNGKSRYYTVEFLALILGRLVK